MMILRFTARLIILSQWLQRLEYSIAAIIPVSRQYPPSYRLRQNNHQSLAAWLVRGGGGGGGGGGGDSFDDDKTAKSRRNEEIQKYYMKQQELLQLRSLIFSEMLAKRGLPMTTIREVAGTEKTKTIVDWDCAVSTKENPKVRNIVTFAVRSWIKSLEYNISSLSLTHSFISCFSNQSFTKTCLYSFDAELNTKVVAPIQTNKWISLSSLNRLRRTDPTKIEPLWHSQYWILPSWFGAKSIYSLLQPYGGYQGIILSFLLDRTLVLKSILLSMILTGFILAFPLLEFITCRFLVSSVVWWNWNSWRRAVRVSLPWKLVVGNVIWNTAANCFGKLEQRLRTVLIEWECRHLEERIPITVD